MLRHFRVDAFPWHPTILQPARRSHLQAYWAPILRFQKFFKNKIAFLRVCSRKKGNFKLLHAGLAVFNSNRFFVLVFLHLT